MVNELQCFEPGCAPLETVENNPIMFKLITEPFCTCACLTNRLSKSTSLCASLYSIKHGNASQTWEKGSKSKGIPPLTA